MLQDGEFDFRCLKRKEVQEILDEKGGLIGFIKKPTSLANLILRLFYQKEETSEFNIVNGRRVRVKDEPQCPNGKSRSREDLYLVCKLYYKDKLTLLDCDFITSLVTNSTRTGLRSWNCSVVLRRVHHPYGRIVEEDLDQIIEYEKSNKSKFTRKIRELPTRAKEIKKGK
jgi:hypothetical protein